MIDVELGKKKLEAETAREFWIHRPWHVYNTVPASWNLRSAADKYCACNMCWFPVSNIYRFGQGGKKAFDKIKQSALFSRSYKWDKKQNKTGTYKKKTNKRTTLHPPPQRKDKVREHKLVSSLWEAKTLDVTISLNLWSISWFGKTYSAIIRLRKWKKKNKKKKTVGLWR